MLHKANGRPPNPWNVSPGHQRGASRPPTPRLRARTCLSSNQRLRTTDDLTAARAQGPGNGNHFCETNRMRLATIVPIPPVRQKLRSRQSRRSRSLPPPPIGWTPVHPRPSLLAPRLAFCHQSLQGVMTIAVP
jgi:hypothetical protein